MPEYSCLALLPCSALVVLPPMSSTRRTSPTSTMPSLAGPAGLRRAPAISLSFFFPILCFSLFEVSLGCLLQATADIRDANFGSLPSALPDVGPRRSSPLPSPRLRPEPAILDLPFRQIGSSHNPESSRNRIAELAQHAAGLLSPRGGRLLPSSSARRSARRRRPAPAPPRACFSAAQELRHPGRAPPPPMSCAAQLLAPPPPRTCSFATHVLRRPIACSAAVQDVLPPPPKTRATKLLASLSPRTCSSATQEARTCAVDIPSRHLGPAPPPPRTCACLGLDRMDREQLPRLELQLPQARPGPQVLSRAWNSSSSSFCCSSASCCSSPACVPARSSPARAAAGEKKYRAPCFFISSAGPVPCSQYLLCKYPEKKYRARPYTLLKLLLVLLPVRKCAPEAPISNTISLHCTVYLACSVI